MPSGPTQRDSAAALNAAILGPVALLAVVAATLISLRYSTTWLVLATDGLAPLLLLAAAWGIGSTPARWLLQPHPWDLRLLCVSVALGSGTISLVTLALGLAGVLNHLIAWGVILAGISCGIPELHRFLMRPGAPELNARREARPALLVRAATCAILGIPLAMVLVGACLPPGVLWPDEAGGYDVLEYHLQAPREYFDAGRISFLPHNVYAAFPQLVEMQYLLMMHLMGGAWAGAIPSQILHAAYGVLAVLAIAAWSPFGIARSIAACLAGTTPWIAYLGCLAYVENPLLFFTAVAGGLLIERLAVRRTVDAPPVRSTACAGVIAGFAVGCKLTAAPMIAAGLAIGWLVGDRRAPAARLRTAAVFALASSLALSPWLLKNALQTGNPVYPFAYSLFGGSAWSVEQSDQWTRGHAVNSAADSLTGRFSVAARELIAFERPNPPKGELPFSKFGIVVIASIAGIASFSPWLLSRLPMLLTWLGFAFIIWALGTQVPGRFAVPLIAPLVWVVAGAFAPREGELPISRWGVRLHTVLARSSTRSMVILIPLLLAGCGLIAAAQYGVFVQFDRQFKARTGASLAVLAGQTELWAAANPTNAALPAGAKALLVGDAAVFYFDKPVRYATVFNRDPWISRAAAGATAGELIAQLRTEGFSQVVFNWSEIERLRATYGFPEFVTREWVASLMSAGLQHVDPPEELAAALAQSGVELLRVVR